MYDTRTRRLPGIRNSNAPRAPLAAFKTLISMTKIYLVRHGITDWNKRRLTQGHSDIELNEDGKAQAAAAGQRMSHLRLDAVYSSDLRRALDTARSIAAPHSLPVIVEPEFREIDEGEWEGLHAEEIARRWPEIWSLRHSRQRPGGESPAAVRRRALAAVGRVCAQHPEGTVAIVTHQGTIREVVGEAMGYDAVKTATITGLLPGEAVVIEGSANEGKIELKLRDQGGGPRHDQAQ